MIFNEAPTAAAVEKYMRAILRTHPCSKIFTAGKSVLGRRIYVLTLGESRGGVLLVGATHGSEWLTASVLLRFFDEVCSSFECGGCLCGVDVRRAVLKRGLAVMPVLNPDGVEINLRGTAAAPSRAERLKRLSGGDFAHWNANAAGVDINHNFGAGWDELQRLEHDAGIYGPAPRQYGGPCPFSEPETRAACGVCSTLDISRLYSLHSQGEEIYWYYGVRTPILSRDIAHELAAASGYAVSSPCGMASHGGLKDWFIESFGRPGFTLEIGRGENPLPLSELDEIYAKLLPALARAAVL